MVNLRSLVWVSSLGFLLALGTTVGCSSSSNNKSSSGGSGGSTGGSSGSGSGGTSGSGSGGTSGSGSGGTAGSSAGGSSGSGSGGTAGSSTGGASGAGGAAGAAGTGGSGGCTGGQVALTVKNYLSWCSVSVAGGAAKKDAEQIVCVDPGSVDLAATALSGFKLGSAPWHDTDGDQGSGDPGTVTGSGQSAKSSTTETVGSSADCVWVCCPFTNGSGCPSSDQCP